MTLLPLFLLASAALAAEARFYFVDVGHGNATFVVAPSGEVMLLDAGPTRAAGRILSFMRQNGISKIDYLVVSHFEDDHMGAAPRIAAEIPVRNFVDHGGSVVFDKSDDWWKQRRGPWFREGMGKQYDASFDVYRAARDKSRHVLVKSGDKVPVSGLEVTVVSAAGRNIDRPLQLPATRGLSCEALDRRAEDDAEDGQSVGVAIRHGRFRFVYLGDLTWNAANSLFCPQNLIGQVDAYLITHHAQSMGKQLGAYYHGLSCCSPAEVQSLAPRVAILSMGGLGHKMGGPDALRTIHGVPGLDLWQTEFIRDGGEKGWNGPEQFIANLGETSEKVPFLELVANEDGSFRMINSRNQFAKPYPGAAPAQLDVESIRRKVQNGTELTPAERETLQRVNAEQREQRRKQYLKDHKPHASSGFTALSDLGAGLYKGEPGGLYPNGRNEPPPDHLRAGIAMAKQVQPLDAQGRPSPEGRIVLLAIGFSNPNMEFPAFQRKAAREPGIHPRLLTVNGCVGGQASSVIADPSSNYWSMVDQRLAAAGVTRSQVQALWIKEVVPGPALEFPGESKKLQGHLTATLQNVHNRFPNSKLAYLSNRTYGGYTEVGGSPEPWAYETGFAVKWAIADQIAGMAGLNYDPVKGEVRAPWAAWGPDLWTDGEKGRKDGLVFTRQDLGDDGLHPSEKGQDKIAALLLDFFKSSPTTRPWFLSGR